MAGRLVLGLRIGEEVAIGPDITIRVTGVERNVVRVSFVAPRDVVILRTELLERARKEQAG